MLRFLSGALLSAYAMTAMGAQVLPDSLYETRLDSPLLDMVYHLRLVPDRHRDINISLYWNYIDSTSFCRADFSIPSVVSVDNTDSAPLECRIYKAVSGMVSPVSSHSLTIRYGRGRDAAFSVVMMADRNGARLDFGDQNTHDGFDIPYDMYEPAALAFVADRATELKTHTLLTRSADARKRWNGDIVFDPSDPVTGLWRYFDRDSNPDYTTGMLDYKIAVVADGESYALIYQGGCADGWNSGDVKGRLLPTPFVGHYDLEWYDSDGRLHSVDTSADLILDSYLLRLNFPLLKTSVRLRKCEPQK